MGLVDVILTDRGACVGMITHPTAKLFSLKSVADLHSLSLACLSVAPWGVLPLVYYYLSKKEGLFVFESQQSFAYFLNEKVLLFNTWMLIVEFVLRG